MHEALGATGGHAVALLAEERPDQRDVPGAGADDRVTYDQAAPHVTLGIRQPGRGALGTQASSNARASRGSVVTLRVRVAYMGAKLGSATMTSWPSPSKQRATHSLSVEASIRIRAWGRWPSTAAKRSGSVRIRCSISSPPRPGHRFDFPSCRRRCQYGPWLASPLCGVDRVSALVGQHMPPRRARGQPLHPIYPLCHRLLGRASSESGSLRHVDRAEGAT